MSALQEEDTIRGGGHGFVASRASSVKVKKRERPPRGKPRDELRGAIYDERLTFNQGSRPRTLESMGIDEELYVGAVPGCSGEEFRSRIEGYWTLPSEDGGQLTRPMTVHVVVVIILNGVRWTLRCLVDGGASRNVLSTSVYEDMKRRGLKRDGTIRVPELRDISGRKV